MLHTLYSRLKWFSNYLEGVPRDAEYLLIDFHSLSSPINLKPYPLDLDQLIMEARSFDAALHHSPF